MASVASVTESGQTASTVDLAGGILGFGVGGSAAAPANTTAVAAPGMTVAKSGRTTGTTCGTVGVINLTTTVTYDPPNRPPFQTTFRDMLLISDDLSSPAFSDAGDSGSLIVDASTAQPVALLVSGGGIFTEGHAIGDVLASFPNADGSPAQIVGGPQHQITCPSRSVGAAASPGSAAQAMLKEKAIIPTKEKLALAKMVKENHERELMGDPAIIGWRPSCGTCALDCLSHSLARILYSKRTLVRRA